MVEHQSKPTAQHGQSHPGQISYHVDAERRIIFEIWAGAIGVVELREHWAVFLADPEVLAVKRTMVDLRRCDIRFTGVEWMEELERFVIRDPVVSGWITAIVAERSYIYGVARQFLLYTDNIINGQIFESVEPALIWLTYHASAPHP